MRKTGRRSFLQLAIVGIVAIIIFIWDRLVTNLLESAKQKIRILPFNKNKTVAFQGNYLVVNHEAETTVFSAHCTHLGCIIDQTEGDRLVCPCHGSEYDLNGNVVKGPAYKNLEIIPSKITADGTHIEIKGS